MDQGTTKPFRILVAEDNHINRKVIEGLLVNFGYEPDMVVNGKDAVEKALEGSYDVIFMDCQMPVMNGYEATTQIRETEIGTDNHIAIIAMTGNSMKGDREKCLDYGMDDYISKPIRIDDFKAIIEKWMAES